MVDKAKNNDPDNRRISEAAVEKRSNDSLGANQASSGGSGQDASDNPSGQAF